ncbi:MAG: FKBP-type peptidyl-prolyl cis-trans isomerase [Balneolaceae bacterium]
MKYFIQYGALVTGALLLLSACNTPGQNPDADLSSRQDSVSYTFGFLHGSQLANEGIHEIDLDNFAAGLQTALNEDTAEIDQMQMQQLIQSYLQEMQMAQMERQAAEAEEHEKEGSEFLEENAQNEDVNVTDSGLQYRVIEEGDGASPSAENEVEVHYTGKLLNGDVFDSSRERGESVTFPLNQVIPGWTEGVQLMTEGSTYEFFIPAALAYGSTPPPGSIIPPGAVLIFEVELIEIK